MDKQFRRGAVSIAVAQAALLLGGAAWAQTTAAPDAPADAAKDAKQLETVIVSGKRAALSSAQNIKRNADEIVDSIIADDIGALPDRSVTEVLQRVVGVTMDRTMAKGDPEHFSIEGSGIAIRGLTYVRSELNGRDSFSANGGRALNFEDVPPELMAGVDVYKNPSAEQIEGAIGGLVNLRTAMPFDFTGFKAALSAESTRQTLRGNAAPSTSGLVSDRWHTDAGDFGVLLSLAQSLSSTRTDAFQVEPYYPLTNVTPGQTVWVPKGSEWRTLDFDRKRQGEYLALQWKKDNVDSSLTFFNSKYQMTWNENALFAQSSPYNITVDPGATYNAAGAFVSGTLRDATDGGINFGDDRRVATRNSDTHDISWKFNWRANDQWSFSSDLQYIKATTNSFDSTIGLGVEMPEETINLAGSVPSLSFSAADRAFLAKPANYYWAYTMEHFDKSTATEKAWKGDARYTFDSPVLQDLRFGLRFTDREANTVNSVPGYNWAAITQPWQKGWDITGLAYLSDPRFSAQSALYSFNNFFGGKANVPALVFPNVSLATNFPASYQLLHGYTNDLCVNAGSNCGAWTPATFGTDPSGSNDQAERTQAGYAQLRFGFEDQPYPVDGNVGLRVVHTDAVAHGHTVFTTTAPNGGNLTGVPIPDIAPFSKAENFDNSYTDVLPSLNLRMRAGNEWQYRFALAKAMTRPDFSQMQAYTVLGQSATTNTTTVGGVTTTNVESVSQTGTASGNPMLKPTKANQADLTAEWYFSKTGSLTFAGFYKQLSDVIVNQTGGFTINDVNGKPQPFTVTTPVNGAKGRAAGLEVAFQTYFDRLPGWLAGFGMQANYTYVDSHQSLYNPVNQAYCAGSDASAANIALNLNGCDVDGRAFNNLPLQNLSKNAYNLALLYDRGPFSARVAYSWRSKYLQAVNVNGTQGTDGTDTNPNSATYGQHNIAWGLPTWADAYGQLDASLFYKVSDRFTLGVEGHNLSNANYRQLMQQHIGMMTRAVFNVGPSYSVLARYSF
ncbi:MAG: TonB-dependent receptor [Pelomonas sp.]|nr:TonB-dependent receptor [Roseateles sp.]